MRGTFISMCAVLAAAIGLCIFSMNVQMESIDQLEKLRISALEKVRSGDTDKTREELKTLSDAFSRRQRKMEIVASHNDLHEAYSYLVDARISLEYGDLDDVGQALAQMGEALAHIREHEKFTINNLI